MRPGRAGTGAGKRRPPLLRTLARSCTLGLLLLTLPVPSSVWAQATSGVALRSSLYVDDDDTVINTSTVSVRAAASDEVTLSARYLIDAISTASVDVVSAATSRWTEQRHEIELGVGYYDGTLNVGGGYIYSGENDWWSHTANLGVAHDFVGHDLTLGVGFTYVDNTVSRADEDQEGPGTAFGFGPPPNAGFVDKMTVIGGAVNVVGVASPDELWAFNYSLSHAFGFQESPYRYARYTDTDSYFGVEDRGMPDQVFVLQGEGQGGERHPDRRLRHALSVRHNRHLFEDSSLRSHVRLYSDDWGVRSLTLGTEYTVGLEPWEIAAFVRGYAQRHADFYQDIYPREQRYMTADRELSSFWDVFLGLRGGPQLRDVGPLSALRCELKVTGFAFFFPEFRRLPRRFGLVVDLGIGGDF